MGTGKGLGWFDELSKTDFVIRCAFFGFISGYLTAIAASSALVAWDIGEARTAQVMIVYTSPLVIMFLGLNYVFALGALAALWIIPLALAPGLSRAVRFFVSCAMTALFFVGITTYLTLALPPRHALPQPGCARNLEALYSTLHGMAYDGRVPELSEIAGQLTMHADSQPPRSEPSQNFEPLLCPTRTWFEEFVEPAHPTTYSEDRSYFYLGYVITGQETLERFSDLYRDRIAAGLPFDRALELEEGTSEFIRRIQKSDFVNVEESDTPPIPLFIERFPNAHRIKGGNVLYTNGDVRWINWGEKWPMTEDAMNVLIALDQMGE